MRHAAAASLGAFVLVSALAVSACAGAGPSAAPSGSTAAVTQPTDAGPSTDAVPSQDAVPSTTPASATGSTALVPTAVPGGETPLPPQGTTIPTTVTDWGTILDDLPRTFPMYPDAGIAEVDGGPFSGTFDVPVDAKAASGWYRDELGNRGYGVEVSAPLEDGSLVLDAQADLPECRIRMTFRPEDGSTIITVLVAAACATGTGG